MTVQRDGDALAMALASCTRCHGYGMRSSRGHGMTVCECVHRHIFRASLARYRIESDRMGEASSWRIEQVAHAFSHGNKSAEYCADFGMLARRTLDDAQYRIFVRHIVAKLPWYRCCTVAGANAKKYFYDSVYRIHRLMGIALAEAGMYPFARYFGGHFIERDMIARSVGVRSAINRAKHTVWRNIRPGYDLDSSRTRPYQYAPVGAH